ncbi:hypothetical protein [Burkholderia cenocepacia]|uniref:hypothetical protein n=1 Tax=Burkholderia cenocepacia TaxID=95486 RepID=UPI0013919876|nr:hypothetical protein [Burkholderia cenocepacia]QKT90174.1 hypothetical protein FOC42_10905 [Burkholderia cenocepacia]UXZ92796.1 hypothetical protein NUJ27_17980 [Burkholderia cenocepacia]HEF5181453.1 hypothetical protein [Burkholderia cenocepacia]
MLDTDEHRRVVVGQYHAYQIASHSRPDLRGNRRGLLAARRAATARIAASWIVIGRYLRTKTGASAIGPAVGGRRRVRTRKKTAGL